MPVFLTAGTAQVGIAPLMDAMIELLPSPLLAKPAVAQGKDGEEILKAADSGPLAAYVWKTTADPYVGKITFLRIYSGSLHADSRVWNNNKGQEERLGTLNITRGKEQMSVKAAHAGDIVSVAKLSVTATGDTFGDKTHPLTLTVPTYPHSLFSVAISPKTQADSAKLSPTLSRLCEEDKTLSWRQEHSTAQTILQGMGDQHIDVAIRKAETKFQTALHTEIPRVPYQEAITKEGAAMHRHKKQTGGAGQFAEVHLKVIPLPEADFEFSNDVFGGSISNNFMASIEKGVRSVM